MITSSALTVRPDKTKEGTLKTASLFAVEEVTAADAVDEADDIPDIVAMTLELEAAAIDSAAKAEVNAAVPKTLLQ